MNPEILRRCASCGASIRERDALFCPECGKPLPAVAGVSEKSGLSPIAETERTTSGDGSGASSRADARQPASSLKEPIASSGTQPQPSQSTVAVDRSLPQTERPDARTNVSGPSRPRIAATRETLHRASAVARGVIEDEVKRVEKIRQVSSVVIEEASYDPSLRFVLVALGLFVVFLVLLVLSKVMG